MRRRTFLVWPTLLLLSALWGEGCQNDCYYLHGPALLNVQVVVTDPNGTPVQNVTFTWHGQTVPIYDFCGDAFCPFWTLKFEQPGPQEMTVSAPGFAPASLSWDSGTYEWCGSTYAAFPEQRLKITLTPP